MENSTFNIHLCVFMFTGSVHGIVILVLTLFYFLCFGQHRLHWHILLQPLRVLLHSTQMFQSGSLRQWRPWIPVRSTSTSVFTCSMACSMKMWFPDNFGFLFLVSDQHQLLLQRLVTLTHSMRTFQSGTLLRWQPCGTVRSTSSSLPSCCSIACSMEFGWRFLFFLVWSTSTAFDIYSCSVFVRNRLHQLHGCWYFQCGHFEVEHFQGDEHCRQYVQPPPLCLLFIVCSRVLVLPDNFCDFVVLCSVDMSILHRLRWYTCHTVFFGCSGFNADISKWVTTQVTTMENSTSNVSLFCLLGSIVSPFWFSFFLFIPHRLYWHKHVLLQRLPVLGHSMRTFQCGSLLKWRACDGVRSTSTSFVFSLIVYWIDSELFVFFFLMFGFQHQLHWHIYFCSVWRCCSIQCGHFKVGHGWGDVHGIQYVQLFPLCLLCSIVFVSWERFSDNFCYFFCLVWCHHQLPWHILLQRFIWLLRSMRTFQSGSLRRWRPWETVRSTFPSECLFVHCFFQKGTGFLTLFLFGFTIDCIDDSVLWCCCI